MDKRIKELIRFAIEQEKKAKAMYEKFAKRASKKSLKEFFKNLAKEEEGHKKSLKNMDLKKIEIKSGKKLDPDSVTKGLEEYQISLKDAKEINDALNFAIEQEEEAYKTYRILMEVTTLFEYKIIVEEIAKQEVIHKTKLLEVKKSFNFEEWKKTNLIEKMLRTE